MIKLKTKILIFLIVWLVFAAVGFIIGLYLFDWAKYRNLSNEGVAIYGKVITKEPENHQNIKYSYEVGEKSYIKNGTAGRGNSSFEELSIGDKVVVYYAKTNPNFSMMGYPQMYQQTALSGAIFCAIFVPFFPLLITVIILIGLSSVKAESRNNL